MGVYFGQAGEIALKRDSLQSALQTKLDPFDVNTATKTETCVREGAKRVPA